MIVCDVCKKPKFTNEFEIPRFKKYITMQNGVDVSELSRVEMVTTDLCDECAKKIAELFDTIETRLNE